MEAVLSVREAYMGVLEDGKVGGWAAWVGSLVGGCRAGRRG
jgi:hypothetical protein